MKPRRDLDRSILLARLLKFSLLSAGSAVLLVAAIARSQPAETQSRSSLRKELEAGNFKDAFEGFRRLAVNPSDDPRQVGDDLALACRALQELGRLDELDDFRESVVRIHAKNWRLLWSAAKTYLAFDHGGTMTAGTFHRGRSAGPSGEGQAVNATERDRVRALQLFAAAMPLADTDPLRLDAASFYLDLANVVLSSRGYNASWHLQTLTGLSELPDYESGWSAGESPQGAPVGADDAPIFYSVPKRWSEAANDGQRWRWALAQAAAFDPQRLNTIRWELARFVQSQFGVETLADYRQLFESAEDTGNTEDSKSDRGHSSANAGVFSLRTLAENETIARLATGVRRFKLPDEFNAIKIYQEIAAEPQTGRGAEAVEALAGIFENRRQYDRAADYWRQAIREYGPGEKNSRRERLQRIIGNWGQFELVRPQPAGRGAKVDFRFRNGRHVSFEAHQIKLDKLVADVKAYLKSNPRPFDGQTIDVQDIGARLMQENQQQYLGARVAAWDLELKPKRHHSDRRVTVTTPLQNAGAYLLTAQMGDGNTSHLVVWLDDTVIVKKPLADGVFYYVADAATGQPIAKANLELFGFRELPPAPAAPGGAIPAPPKPAAIETVDFADQTDADGQLIVKPRPNHQQFNWLVVATTATGRFAYLGFTNIASSNLLDTEYNETKVFAISDSPVYRAGQKAKFKFWVRHAKYDQPDSSDFANQSFTVEIRNPKGEKLLAKTMTTDAYGGLDGEFAIPPQATLGVYQFALANYGGGSFRVEEYKKPEYEVSIETPVEPVLLGQTAKATIRARYYFGSPVSHATVKYKILRSHCNESLFPAGDWDWLYGRGYWWFGYDYDWHPGWATWGCARPAPSWSLDPSEPPEVVAEREVPIGLDGTVTVEIDTALAKTLHPDQDHRYEISAEVIDASRRKVFGSGRVLASRKQFQVFVSVDRGYYHVEDVIRADCWAQSLGGKAIRGDGRLSLFKIAYKDGQPQESPVRDWNLSTGADGRATLQIKASEPGQYRLSFKLIDEQKRSSEGGYVFSIVGQGIDGSNFRFNDLELVPDRRQYAPDQTVNLMVNTARADSAVVLFVRPVGGVYLPPKLLRLTGKSIVEQIRVLKRDMPNFFVEALTIADGKLYTEVRQIVVPPESRVLNVAVQPSRDTYRPGQPATVLLKLTDAAGHPMVGSAVLAIYDKSLEDISAGSNSEDIKAFFWRWTRSHQPVTESNLFRTFENAVQANQSWMQELGVFGGRGSPLLTGQGNGAADSLGQGVPAGAAHALSSKVQPTVRSNFADTALWVGALETNAKGEAEVSLNMPENLATWKVRVWGMGHGTKVGQGDAEVVTR